MKYNYDFIVIGAGSAGLTVASASASLGAKVLLIEKNKMGGDCLNTGCVPSKAFLKFSHTIKELEKMNKLGMDFELNKINFNSVMTHVSNSIKSIEPKDSKERYTSLGVDVAFGNANFHDKHSININDKIYTGKNIVIATGSRPFIPEIKGLNPDEILTSENIFELTIQPKKLLILGGGPIGLELGQGFAKLKTEVFVVDRTSTFFKNDEPEVANILKESLEKDGINFYLNSQIIEITKNSNGYDVLISKDGETTNIYVDKILVSSGRKPNVEGLGLEKIGLQTNKRGYISTDLKMRTSIKNIYACGDISGNFGFTHMAGYEASVVIRNAIFKLPYKADYSKVAWTTYTSPEVAHTGLTEKMAKDSNKYGSQLFLKFDNSDRFIIEDEKEGFIKVILNPKGIVIGATIVSDNSSELIHTLSILIAKKLKVSELLNLIVPYPMRGDILKELAFMKSKEMLTPFSKSLIKNIFLKL
ncbi:MAG: dihydrolipoyl dehydrogenase family protein [Sarcina sp.]